MGTRMERILKPVFENKFGTLNLTDKYNNFDYFNNNVLIELKTRNINWGQYDSLIFSTAKLNKAIELTNDKDFKKEIYFFWKLKDGLFYWKFNKNETDVHVGGTLNASGQYQDVVYIKNEYIKNYNDLSFKDGYWKN